MNIDEMKAGRELDAMIAEKIMGLIPCDKWKKHYGGWGMAIMGEDLWEQGDCGHGDKCFPQASPQKYSRDVGVAWKVVEKIPMDIVPGDTGWCAGKPWNDYSDGEWDAHADTAPLAICRASLKAVEYKEVEK